MYTPPLLYRILSHCALYMVLEVYEINFMVLRSLKEGWITLFNRLSGKVEMLFYNFTAISIYAFFFFSHINQRVWSLRMDRFIMKFYSLETFSKDFLFTLLSMKRYMSIFFDVWLVIKIKY